MDKDTKLIILKRPYLLYTVNCSHCHTTDLKPTSTDIVHYCKTCHKKTKSEAYIDLYNAYCGLVMDSLSPDKEYHHVLLSGIKEDKSKVDLTPRNKYEDDVLHCLLHFQHNFKKTYIVNDIETNKMSALYTECKDCSICHTCVTCCDCLEVYVPKRKNGYLVYSCPKCKSKKYKFTVIKNQKTKTCPQCNSVNITASRILSEYKECPNCKSKNIKKADLIPCYQLKISKYPRDY
jgi:hypothetical protein